MFAHWQETEAGAFCMSKTFRLLSNPPMGTIAKGIFVAHLLFFINDILNDIILFEV
jgi:hypothetical protein